MHIISLLQLGRVEKGRENLRFSDLKFFYRPVMVNHNSTGTTFGTTLPKNQMPEIIDVIRILM